MARLPGLYPVAPRLRSLPVRMLRVLGMRGRLWRDMICVGIPLESGEPTLEHVLWQAAHEATVCEIAERAAREQRPLPEREVEQFSVALLARRARRSAAVTGHGRWLGRMAPEVAAWTDPRGLSDEGRNWLEGFPVDALERNP
jgi:hypothetical protein